MARQDISWYSLENGRHCTDDIFNRMNGKFGICILISLKFVPNGPIDNASILVQVMTWHRTGDKPLSEPIMIHFTDA